MLMARLVCALLLAPLTSLVWSSPLAQFAHTAWTVEAGAPADIWTLEQAPAGYLWLGTGQGLYRFDGVRFDRYPLREGQRLKSTNINALLALPDGDIWLGLYAGGTVRLRDGIVSSYGAREGMPTGRVLRFAGTRDGALWAAALQGLARYDGRRWQRIGADWGYPDDGAYYVFVDRRGILWVAGERRLHYLLPGMRRFQTVESISRHAVLAEDLAGRIWISDDLGGTRPLPDYPRGANPPATPAAPRLGVPFARAKQLLFSSDGSLWLTVSGEGVHRLRTPAAIADGRSLEPGDGLETFSRSDGLPSDVAVPLVQGDEGEVWVGTNHGLASFRPLLLQGIPEMSGAQRNGFVLAEQEQGVLAAHSALALHLDPPAQPRRQAGPNHLRFAVRAPDGALWRVDGDGIWREQQGQRRPIPIEAASLRTGVVALAPDRVGGAWMSVNGVGVLYATTEGVRHEHRIDPGSSTPTAIAVGPDGAAWFGYDDRVVRLSGAQVQEYTAAHGLLTGRTSAIHSGRGGVYVAGESGFARFDGQRFVTISAERDDSFAHVTGIAESETGDLWLNGGRGVVQLLAADIPDTFSGMPARRNYRLLNWRDGLPGIALQANPSPTIVRDRRGRLWFLTNRGIAWLDPRHVPRNERPPVVEIQHLRVGERLHLPGPELALDAGTRNISIRYTALTLSAAERARFRYRLEGIDSDWQDADTRREASYANLGAGDYRFLVTAANGDGVWNPHSAELRFSIEPTLVQRRSFLAACALAILGLAWCAYLLRARTIAARVRLRLETRHGERERIARELHDTLLQSTQGLIVNVQGLASHLPAHEPVRQRIEAVLDRADEVVMEARERVLDLRSTEVSGAYLAERLAKAGRELAEQHDIVFRLVTSGEPQPLQRAASDELYSLAREALINAFRHAQPRQVEVEIAFGCAELVLRVRDDGIGIVPELLEGGSSPGHWGLTGMRERACLLGGGLQLSSRPHGGTEIECRVPAASAYRNPPAGVSSRSRGAWWSSLLMPRWRRWES